MLPRPPSQHKSRIVARHSFRKTTSVSAEQRDWDRSRGLVNGGSPVG